MARIYKLELCGICQNYVRPAHLLPVSYFVCWDKSQLCDLLKWKRRQKYGMSLPVGYYLFLFRLFSFFQERMESFKSDNPLWQTYQKFGAFHWKAYNFLPDLKLFSINLIYLKVVLKITLKCKIILCMQYLKNMFCNRMLPISFSFSEIFWWQQFITMLDCVSHISLFKQTTQCC